MSFFQILPKFQVKPLNSEITYLSYPPPPFDHSFRNSSRSRRTRCSRPSAAASTSSPSRSWSPRRGAMASTYLLTSFLVGLGTVFVYFTSLFMSCLVYVHMFLSLHLGKCQRVINAPRSADTPYRDADIVVGGTHPVHGDSPYTQQSRSHIRPLIN